MSKKAQHHTQTDAVPRWLLHSQISRVVGRGPWSVLIALVQTQSRLIHMCDSAWHDDDVWAPFRFRQAELVGPTGLTDRAIREHLVRLASDQIIDYRPGTAAKGAPRGNCPSECAFNSAFFSRAALYVIPRLPHYLGGVANLRAEEIGQFAFWLGADIADNRCYLPKQRIVEELEELRDARTPRGIRVAELRQELALSDNLRIDSAIDQVSHELIPLEVSQDAIVGVRRWLYRRRDRTPAAVARFAARLVGFIRDGLVPELGPEAASKAIEQALEHTQDAGIDALTEHLEAALDPFA